MRSRPTRQAVAAADASPSTQRTRLPAWELTLLLLASLNYWTDLLRIAFLGADSASAAFRTIHFAFYGLFCWLLLRDPRALGLALRRAPLLLAVLLLPLASTVWSINPGETLPRAVALLGSSLFGLYVAIQIAPLLALRVLAWTACLAAGISIVLIFAFPTVGLMTEGEYVDVWSGAFIHKNGLGQMTALGAIVSLIVLMAEGIRRNRLIALGLLLNLVLLAGSRSLTSQIVFAASVVMILTVGRCVRFIVHNAVPIALAAAPIIIALGATLGVDDALRLLELAGKNASFSSRVPLWQLLVEFIEQRIWLGWGYEAFFTEANYAYRIIEEKLHFKPYYAHNGYIETWVALGGLGFLSIVLLFVRFSTLAVRNLYANDRNPLYLLCFVYVPVFLIQNTAEATILQRNSMSWALFVLLYLYLAQIRPTEPARQDVGAVVRVRVA